MGRHVPNLYANQAGRRVATGRSIVRIGRDRGLRGGRAPSGLSTSCQSCVPRIHLVAARHREARRPQVFEAFVVVHLRRVARLGLEDGAGREAAEMNIVPGLPLATDSIMKRRRANIAACTCRSPDAGDLRGRHLDVAAGDEREEVARDHRVARILARTPGRLSISMSLGRVDGEDAGTPCRSRRASRPCRR